MLKEILSISGKPGLYRLVNKTPNAIIVESLSDGKRFPAYSNSRILGLEDISIYTDTSDILLREVLKKMMENENSIPVPNHKSDKNSILKYFEEILPDYDKDRVYISDIKKILQWYSILTEKGLSNLITEDEEEEN